MHRTMAGAYCFACPSSPESPSSLLFSSLFLVLLIFMLFIFPSAAPVFMPTNEFHSSQWPLPDFLSLPVEIVTKPTVAVSSSFFLYSRYFVFCMLYFSFCILYFSFFLFPFSFLSSKAVVFMPARSDSITVTVPIHCSSSYLQRQEMRTAKVAEEETRTANSIFHFDFQSQSFLLLSYCE